MKNNEKFIEVLKTKLGLNANQIFNREIPKLLKAYGQNNAEKARDKVLKYLKDQNTKVDQDMIDAVMNIIRKQYNKGIDEIYDQLLKKRKALYKFYKRRLPIVKALWIDELAKGIENVDSLNPVEVYVAMKQYNAPVRILGRQITDLSKSFQGIRDHIEKTDYLSYSLSSADQRAILMLTVADIVYIKDYWTHAPIAKTIRDALTAAMERGTLGNQIAGKLAFDFAEYTPEKYAEIFGDFNYWDGVAQGYNTLTKSATVINDFDQAGYDTFRWYARMTERTCKICSRLHNKVFSVKKSVAMFEEYYAAAENEDIEAMNKANAWLKKPEDVDNLTEKDGYFPPAHFKCKCFIRMDTGVPYK